jgi:hypothetical protein
MPAYELLRTPHIKHEPTSLSHIGGYPNLPANILLPTCKFCDAPMTFFFQLEFPKKHDWFGKIMAVFACTSCTRDKGNHLPAVSSNFKQIPDGFLNDYQDSFKIFVINKEGDNVIRTDYTPKISPERVSLQSLNGRNPKITRIGGQPNWRISNDFPEQYMGSRFTFLMQIWDDWGFKKLPDAPPQAIFSFLNPSKKFRNDDSYFLFLGLPLYFFGTLDLEQPKVYVLNQK